MTIVGSPMRRSSVGGWIDEVPAHWSLDRVGQHFVERRETVSDEDFRPLSVTKNGVVPQLDTVAKTGDGENRKRVARGDLVINSRSDRKGSSGLSDLEGSVSTISIVLRPRDIDARFAHYLLRSQPFQEEFYRYGSGIVDDLWSTRWAQMRDIKIPVPPLEEQRGIVHYLDHVTSRIDGLIERHLRLREVVFERRNALVYEALSVSQSVRVGRLLMKLSRPTAHESEVLTAYRDGQVTRRSERREEGYTLSSAAFGYQGVHAGDLVFHGLDGFAGAVGVAEMAGICSPVYHVAAARRGVNVRYVAIALQVLAAQGFLAAQGGSVRQRSVDFRNWATFSALPIGVPPIQIQNEIVEAHERGLAVVRRESRVVDLLRERREALIARAVTGKTAAGNL